MKRLIAVCAILLVLSVFAVMPASARDFGEIGFMDEPFADLHVNAAAVSLSTDGEADPYARMKKDIAEAAHELWVTGDGEGFFSITNSTDYNLSPDDLKTIYYNALYDYPEELYFCMTGLGYYCPENGSYFTPGEIIRVIPYFVEADDAAYKAALDKACLEIFGAEDGTNDDMTEFEKVTAAHDWLVLNVFYDPYVGHGGKTYTTAGGTVYEEDDLVYTSYGAFVNGKAVCQGYALAFKVLMDRAGVDTYVVTSDEMGHAWNLVRVDGAWYHIDCTWDDPVYTDIGDYAGRAGKDNFLFSDGDSQGHSGWTSEFDIVCPENYELPECFTGKFSDVFLYDGKLYVIADRLAGIYNIGDNFAGTPQEMAVMDYEYALNNAAALDYNTGVLYVRGKDLVLTETAGYYENRIFTVDLNAGSVLGYHCPSENSCGVGICEDPMMPGSKILYTKNDYELIDKWSVNTASTDPNLPVVIYYVPSLTLEELGGNTLRVVTEEKSYTLLAAAYAGGRMIGVWELMPGDYGFARLTGELAAGADEVKIFAIGENARVLASSISIKAQ